MSGTFENWCHKPKVTNTMGRGWCVRIDGCDVFDIINGHGVKKRRAFNIASDLESKEEAQQVLRAWLTSSLAEIEK